MKLKLLILAVPVVFTSCEKTVPLDMRQTEEKIVIEGLVTNDAAHNYVKVSRTTAFYSSGSSPRVTNATVTVEDNDGNLFNLIHNPGNNPDSVGYYLPEVPFAGEVGKTYKLTVLVDGKSYEAQDKLIRLVAIDKLEYRINPDEQADPEEDGRIYELLLYVKEPQETTDYYLFKSFRNGVVEYANETDVYFADGELIGEDIDGVPLPVFYAAEDKARVEVFSLSRDAFVFYRDLQKLMTNDGGMFGTPPANPRNNLSNGAMGFFQVSAVQAGELIVGQ